MELTAKATPHSGDYYVQIETGEQAVVLILSSDEMSWRSRLTPSEARQVAAALACAADAVEGDSGG